MRKQETVKLILTIALAIMTAVAGFSAYKIITISQEYHKEEEIHKQLIDEVIIKDEPAEGDKEVEESPYLKVDHDKLREINKEYIGWINVPETNISHPVVQTDDNQYYVHVGFDGHYSANGAIFGDYRQPDGFDGFNLIMYGHLRNNKTMFWYVSQFRHSDYYYAHQQVEIYRDGKVDIYKPFAFFKTKSDSKVYTTRFSSITDQDVYINYLISNSYYTPEVEVTPDDHIIVMSTCTDATSDNRWVLCCVRTETIDLSNQR